MTLAAIGPKRVDAYASDAVRGGGPDVHTRLDELAQANAALQAEINEHRRAVDDLREAKERLDFALDGSRLALWDYRIATGGLYLCGAWADVLDQSQAAIETTLVELMELTHPDERALLRAEYVAAIKGLIPELRVELRIRTRSGHWKWILCHGKVIERAEDGRATRVIGTNADITERKESEQVLADRLAELRLVQDHAPVMIAYYDREQCCRYANRKYAAFYRDSPENMVGRHCRDIVGDIYPTVRPEVLRTLAGETCRYEREHDHDGDRLSIVVELVPHQGADGRTLGFYAMLMDVTERKRAEDMIRESERRFRDVVDASGEYIWETNPQGQYTYLSKRAETVLGWPVERLIGRAPVDLMPPGEAERVERWLAGKKAADGTFTDLEHTTVTQSGEIVWQWVSGKPVTDDDGNMIAFRGTGANITERKRHEARIEQLATRDSLTGLPNRVLLHDRLAHAIAAEGRTRTQVATMFIDLDRFKTINDSLGHHVGDAVLKQMAARLEQCLREDDTIARPGGDEFVVVATGLKDEGDAALIAGKILAAISRPLVVEGHQLVTTCSIGISLFPGDADAVEPLLKHADTAMYHAKAGGGDAYRFFSLDMNRRAVERLALENDLRAALLKHELVLHYQPIVDFESGRIVGVEALARWIHAGRGAVPPARFIAIAEETGLIVPLGEWALATACAQAKAWHDAGHRGLRMAVNLSAGQLRDSRAFTRKIDGVLRDTRLDPTLLDLEITESLLMHQSESNFEALRQLAELGVRPIVDDFGTGYSSLSYLKRLPIQGLKIDRSFVRDVAADAGGTAIVRAVVSLARSLNLTVTAEGVETAEQLAVLRGLDCDDYQGYLYSPALAADEFAAKFL